MYIYKIFVEAMGTLSALNRHQKEIDTQGALMYSSQPAWVISTTIPFP